MIQNKNLQHFSLPQYNCFHPSPSPTTTHHLKRPKRQQSRARKLQYIADLERNIQALQVEGFGVIAECEFLKQQNRILGMENTTLKHRLDSLSQEHFIKCLEQEMLEKEITRLRNLYVQQQQPQHKHYAYAIARPRSRSQHLLDSSFSHLSLKDKEGS